MSGALPSWMVCGTLWYECWSYCNDQIMWRRGGWLNGGYCAGDVLSIKGQLIDTRRLCYRDSTELVMSSSL